jgi:SOS response associated peptidase (SRAP)
MCGRFTQRYTWSEVLEFLRVFGPPRNLQPHYNIAPTMTVDAIRLDRDGKRELVPMRWGLIPAWWPKSLKEIPATFNARAESVADKPTPSGGSAVSSRRAGSMNGPATRATSSRIFLRRPTAPLFSPWPAFGTAGAIARPAKMSCHARSSCAGLTSGCRPITTACPSFWTRRISKAGLTVPLARMPSNARRNLRSKNGWSRSA